MWHRGTDDAPWLAPLIAALPRRIGAVPRRWAAERPDAVAVVDTSRDGNDANGPRRWTWAGLVRVIDACAAMLRGCGVRPGDRVMVVAENSIDEIAMLFAITELDAWAVLVNPRLSEREVDAIRDHCTPRAIVLPTRVAGDVAVHAARMEAKPAEPAVFPGLAIVGGGTGSTAHCVPEPVFASGAEQVAALVYTSGTTGRPKGVMLTHRNLLFVASVSARLRDLKPGDRAFGALPMYHVFGLASMLLGTLVSGATLYAVPRFSAQGALRLVADESLTIFQAVPAMYARMLEAMPNDESPQARSARCPHGARVPFRGQPCGSPRPPFRHALRFLYAGGSPLDPTLKAEVERRFGIPLHNGYGLTETSPTVSQTRLDAPRSDTSVGPPIPGVEVRIVPAVASAEATTAMPARDAYDTSTTPARHAYDTTATPARDAYGTCARSAADAGGPTATECVHPGDIGELWIRGPNVMKGYYRDPVATAEAITADGWLRTGDLARQDPDGALFVVGRSKELIIRSGLNVYPTEVESVLNAHPAVSQSVVVGRPAAAGNEEVVAFVELVPNAVVGTDELLAYAAAQLAPYKRPVEIVVMPVLPASGTGKVLRGQLRALARERATASSPPP